MFVLEAKQAMVNLGGEFWSCHSCVMGLRPTSVTGLLLS